MGLLASSEKGIYMSLDDFNFETHRLAETVATLYGMGYRLFLLDEVHRYEWWSMDLKQLNDNNDDIRVVATGSSILDSSQGNADLSRRASFYHLPGLTFREYLNFKKNLELNSLPLQEILANHHAISLDLLDVVDFESDFQNYFKSGYFPFFLETNKTYFQKLQETIQLVIDSDIAPYEQLQHTTTKTLKKLLLYSDNQSRSPQTSISWLKSLKPSETRYSNFWIFWKNLRFCSYSGPPLPESAITRNQKKSTFKTPI